MADETCFRCDSERLAFVNAKCSDMCQFRVKSEGIDQDDYAPYDVLGESGGDYIEFTYCLDCGQIQSGFPVETDELKPEEKDGE
jgi:hypothetical protein